MGRPGMPADGGGYCVKSVEVFDRAVGGESDGDAGAEHRFEGIGEASSLGPEALWSPDVGGDELGLDGDDDFVFGHPLKAIGWAERCMLDAVAVNFIGFAVQGKFDGVEGFAKSLIADGVDGELEAFLLSFTAF